MLFVPLLMLDSGVVVMVTSILPSSGSDSSGVCGSSGEAVVFGDCVGN